MTTPVRLDSIRAADWQPKLHELGAVVEGGDDVLQCVRIILLTPKGSVPHRPDFGSDLWRFLDWPLPSARPHIVSEVVDAIAIWEPRITITAVEVEIDEDSASSVVIRLTGRLVSGAEIKTAVGVAA